MRLQQNANDGSVGFQIAPMIDVVFVIMLLFMVMAGAVKVENELNTTLPGSAETSNSVEFVDEQIISVDENNGVALNDEPFDNATSKDLPQLTATLMRLKQSSDAARSTLVVTIASENRARFERTIDVLNAPGGGADQQRDVQRQRRRVDRSRGRSPASRLTEGRAGIPHPRTSNTGGGRAGSPRIPPGGFRDPPHHAEGPAHRIVRVSPNNG